MFSAKDLFFTPPAGGYTIAKSLRFRSSASAYLSRTPGSAGTSNKIMTISDWVKRGSLGSIQSMFGAVNSSNTDNFRFSASDQLEIVFQDTAAGQVTTTQVFRDPSSWYHVVLAIDTTQATASSRVKMYVNGAQITTFATATYPAQNTAVNFSSAVSCTIGKYANSASQYFDGYLSEVNFIDGQALDPTYFGQTDTATGVWMPKAYSGTGYGNNGFYLKFTDVGSTSGSNTGYGKDFAGTNYWTTNNLSSTAGTTYDSMVDTPTNYDNGGNGAGNYCVLNPLSVGANTTISDANLKATNSASHSSVRGTIGVTSGKWYWEVTALTTIGNIGIETASASLSTEVGKDANGWGYLGTGQKYTNATPTSYGSTYTTNDVIAVAFDADNGAIYFGKISGGTIAWQNSGVPTSGSSATGAAFTGLTNGPYFPAVGNASATQSVNFGQQPFSASSLPSGFKALCTQNLPTPTIGATSSTNAASYMNAVTYPGATAPNTVTATSSNSGNNPLAITFQPDFVWIKSRSAATDHKLTDSVRGVTKALISNTTGAETTDTNGLTAFTASGFTVGSDTVYNNTTGPQTYVAWEWLAGTAPTTDNVAGAGNVPTAGSVKINGSNSTSALAGSIAATRLSANVTAGFSVVTWTGNGSTSSTVTIGHGLGVAPKMIIIKKRSSGTTDYGWSVWHTSLGGNYGIFLNSTAAKNPGMWAGYTNISSTVFSPADTAYANESTQTYVTYCFAEVAGYSKFGSYTGNGSADGPFCYTGFQPKYVLIKRTDTTASWCVIDAVRDTYNAADKGLVPDLSAAEGTGYTLDFLSNGFKLRLTGTAMNASGGTYIFAAFAETPFNYARAR